MEPLNESTIRDFARDTLLYEYQMLLTTERRIGAAQRAGDGELVNIALESFLLHVRNLAEFYVKVKSNRANVYLYLPTHDQKGRWRDARKSISTQVTVRTFEGVSEWLSHPSLGRNGVKPSWNVSELRSELFRLLQAFCEILTPEIRSWFAWVPSEAQFRVVISPPKAVEPFAPAPTVVSTTVLSLSFHGSTD